MLWFLRHLPTKKLNKAFGWMVILVFTFENFYILWRAIAPPKFGGSRAIAREEWEPLPWPWLILAGGLMVMITVFTVIAYPELIIF